MFGISSLPSFLPRVLSRVNDLEVMTFTRSHSTGKGVVGSYEADCGIVTIMGIFQAHRNSSIVFVEAVTGQPVTVVSCRTTSDS